MSRQLRLPRRFAAVCFSYFCYSTVFLSLLAGSALQAQERQIPEQAASAYAACTITTSSLPAGEVGKAYYSGNLQTEGCTPPLTWTISLGALPPGLVLGAGTGPGMAAITGTPTSGDRLPFNLRAVDKNGNSSEQELKLRVAVAIKVEWDEGKGHGNAGNTVRIVDAQFEMAGDPAPFKGFGSVGDPNGACIENTSKFVWGGAVLKLTSGDTFDCANSTGGKAFPDKPACSRDKKMITFSGGNIAKKAFAWNKIPLSKDRDPVNGHGIYEGYLTKKPPTGSTQGTGGANGSDGVEVVDCGGSGDVSRDSLQAMPSTIAQLYLPFTGNYSSAQISYDGNGNFTVGSGGVNFVIYTDSSEIVANTPYETIIGNNIYVAPMQLALTGYGAPSSYPLTNGAILVNLQPELPPVQDYLDGSLNFVTLIPDSSVPGFDSVLQGTVLMVGHSVGLTSRYVDEYFALFGYDVALSLEIRTNLLEATGNLTHAGTGVGYLIVGMSNLQGSSSLGAPQ